MPVHDRIEKVMTLRAPRERVWSALTTAAGLSQWFGSSAEIELRPGGDMRFGWPSGEAARARIEVLDPPRQFAYRWRTSGARPEDPVEAGPNTLVEFTLEDVPEGTKLTLIESGFAALPEEIAAKSLADNTEGWTSELGDLAAFVEAVAVPVANG